MERSLSLNHQESQNPWSSSKNTRSEHKGSEEESIQDLSATTPWIYCGGIIMEPSYNNWGGQPWASSKCCSSIHLCCYRRTTHVTPPINQIGWESLHIRRLLAQTSMFFKIHHNLMNVSFPPCVQPAFYIARHDHQLKYNIPAASMEATNSHFIHAQFACGTNNLPLLYQLRQKPPSRKQPY